MIDQKLKLAYSDISIVPSILSDIESRQECKLPKTLPLFTAPMTSVVGLTSASIYKKNGIIPILPRNISLSDRWKMEDEWIAVSLSEFETLLETENLSQRKILIDIANGHMKVLYNLARKAKEKYPDLILMVGNIANPSTYLYFNDIGVDYVRLGIGAGAGCITSSNTAIHYPMASLIDETYALKQMCNGKTKIVADGGIRGYSDIIKALALGADYVMIGSVFSKMLESEGDIYEESTYTILDKSKIIYSGEGRFIYDNENINLRKLFYGMASKRGQQDISGCTVKTSEGIEREIKVEYTMSAWVENLKSYLRSSMSYTGCKTLEEFRGKVKIIQISNQTINSVNK